MSFPLRSFLLLAVSTTLATGCESDGSGESEGAETSTVTTADSTAGSATNTTGDGDGDGTDTGSAESTSTDTGDATGTSDTTDGGETGDPCGEPVSFSGDVQPVLDSRCAGANCHSSAAAKADLDLQTDMHGALVNVMSGQCNDRLIVQPGAPEASYLVDKIKDQNLCFGDPMPKIGALLSAGQIADIENWICRGAPND